MSLPKDYEVPTKDSNYFKPQDGDNKVRVLSDFHVGYMYWTNDKKPVRLKERPESIPANMQLDGSIKEMWLCVVWNYVAEKIAIWEITQSTIMRSIYEYEKDEDYGDSKGYDLKINRKGKELETKYNVIAGLPKEVDEKINQSYEEDNISEKSLEEMFDSKDVVSFNDKLKEDKEEVISADDIPF